MKVSLDGGKTYKEVEEVRIIQDVDFLIEDSDENDDSEISGELHFNFTHEGLITDAWVNDVNEGTSSTSYMDLGDDLVNG